MRATKQITVSSAPNVLVVHLKRFEYSLYGHKISKKVRSQRLGHMRELLMSRNNAAMFGKCIVMTQAADVHGQDSKAKRVCDANGNARAPGGL